ncbi:MAG: hypothetical protein HGA85_06085 [Nanoarchaeota archaeon]|nr:hypothetical protein [Nanoarchaeota archaeon]
MQILGQVFTVENRLGMYSLIAFFFLFLLYLMRPKPFKKVIPSLIFLESSEKRMTMSSFFRKFVKDWLIFLQFFVILLLCMGAMDIATEIVFRKLNTEVAFVIDASASSKSKTEGKMLFDTYKEIAKKRVGLSNSIILVKASPEVVAKQVNPVTSINLISGLKPSDSLSNIWDAIIVASSTASPGATIIVLSDFQDSNNKDIALAQKIVEAKGFKVEMITPVSKERDNAGIIGYTIAGDSITVQLKNFNSAPKEVEYQGTKLTIPGYGIEKASFDSHEGTNRIEIRTGDDFSLDDSITLTIPKEKTKDVLLLTNKKKAYLRSALESIKGIKLTRAEPPIVNIGNQKIFVLCELDYSNLLPGTIDKIRQEVSEGASLIVCAQEGLDQGKLDDLMPVRIVQQLTQDVEIENQGSVAIVKDFNFGQSSKYLETTLTSNSSLIIAQAADKLGSPAIVLMKYGTGNVLFYGLLDDYNQFKLTPQYPIFWITVIDLLTQKEYADDLNFKVSEIIYANLISGPGGISGEKYLVPETEGDYTADGNTISVNMISSYESDINKKVSSGITLTDGKQDSIKQKVLLLPAFALLAVLMLLLEIYAIKKRGDI